MKLDGHFFVDFYMSTGDLGKIMGHSQKGFEHFSSRYISTRAV